MVATCLSRNVAAFVETPTHTHLNSLCGSVGHSPEMQSHLSRHASESVQTCLSSNGSQASFTFGCPYAVLSKKYGFRVSAVSESYILICCCYFYNRLVLPRNLVSWISYYSWSGGSWEIAKSHHNSCLP